MSKGSDLKSLCKIKVGIGDKLVSMDSWLGEGLLTNNFDVVFPLNK